MNDFIFHPRMNLAAKERGASVRVCIETPLYGNLQSYIYSDHVDMPAALAHIGKFNLTITRVHIKVV